MPKVGIVTDSTCDLSEQAVRELAITIVPLHVHIGDETYLDGVQISSREVLDRMTSDKVLAKTSAPSPQEFRKAFESRARDCSAILCITLSTNWSGTYNSAVKAAQDFKKTPVKVIDSGSVSMGLGFIVMDAARAAREGKSLEEIEDIVRESASRTAIAASMGTLEYLQRSGRIGKVASFLGSILEIKPTITVAHGDILPYHKTRTKRKAIRVLVDWFDQFRNPAHVGIIWSTDEEDMNLLLELLSAKYSRDQIQLATYSPVIGAHIGPGTTGLVVVDGPNGR